MESDNDEDEKNYQKLIAVQNDMHKRMGTLCVLEEKKTMTKKEIQKQLEDPKVQKSIRDYFKKIKNKYRTNQKTSKST